MDVTHVVPDSFRVSFSKELGEAKIRWYVGEQKFALRLPIEEYKKLAAPEHAVMPVLREIEDGHFEIQSAGLVPMANIIPEGAEFS